MEAEHHPLAQVDRVAQVRGYDWPDPVELSTNPSPPRWQQTTASTPSRRVTTIRYSSDGYLRGMEQSFEDLVLHAEITDAILGHIFDIYHEVCRRIFEAGRGKIDLTFVAEDLGSQTGPLISLDTYRRFLFPHQK